MLYCLQDTFGKRAPNATLAEIEKDAKKLREGLDTASRNNTNLRDIMQRNIGHLQLLSGPLDQLQGALPSVAQLQCKQHG